MYKSRFTRFGVVILLLVLGVNFSVAQLSAGFTVNAPVPNCNPAVYSFTNTTSGGIPPLTYQWNFGVFPGVNSVFQNPSTTYLGCGSYNVTLIVTDSTGQKDTSIQTVTVRCSPTANFSVSTATGCAPLSTNFTSTSNPGSGTVTGFEWDFGDGSSATGSNPTHVYNVGGCKNITLIVTNSFGCIKDTTLNNMVCVNAQPVSDFTSNANTSCSAPFTVSYQATSSGGLGPYSYQWLFPGGSPSTSSSANPTVTYNSEGSFDATLITTDAHGCTDTTVKSNFISVAANTASLTLGSAMGCVPSTVTAVGTASSSPLSWNWTVSPSAVITNTTTPNTSFIFNSPGSYNVCVSIDYPGGCTVQNCSSVVINPKPVAGYSISGNLNTCIHPDVVTFINSSSGSGLTYNWSFPGGTPGNSANTSPVVTYSTCGVFSASLTVTDANGCAATDSSINFLNVTCPVTSFTVSPRYGCVPLTANFSGITNMTNVVSWSWDFGDPASGSLNTSNQQNASHTYNSSGCYDVTLTVVNDQGCTSTYTMPGAACCGFKPHANFSGEPPVNCANQPFQFIDSSTGTYSYTTYAWDFHDVPPYIIEDTAQNPVYTYFDVGTYDITLIVSNYGCADTLTKDSYVQTLAPSATPKVIRNCGSRNSVILDGSGSHQATSYLWTIPGGTPSTATTPTVTVTYPGPGTYTASLYVQNDTTGCFDLQPVEIVVPDIYTDFTGSPLSGCAPLTTCLSNLSTAISSVTWVVTDQTGSVTGTYSPVSPCIHFHKAGFYNVLLVVADSFGCNDSVYKPDYISVYNPTANFVAVPQRGCVPLSINFEDSSISPTSTISQWDWNFGDIASGSNDSSRLQNPLHIYNTPGSYTVSLQVKDNHGCPSDTIKYNYIRPSRLQPAFTIANNNSCQGTQSCFNISSVDTNHIYNWNFGDGSTSSQRTPCHFYPASGNYRVMFIESDTSGCIDTVTKLNPVNIIMPAAAFTADSTSANCPPLPVNFINQSASTDSSSTYYWMFGDGQVSSLRNPFHIYNNAGVYTVTLIVTNSSGCRDTLVMPNYINLQGPSAFVTTPPTSGCVPHYTCFSVNSTSTVRYTWNFGDGTVIAGTQDSICYTYTRTGTFNPELILTDAGGCIYSQALGTVNVGGAVAYFTNDGSAFCDSGTVNFTDSSYGSFTVQSWLWNFGDPGSAAQNTSTVQNPSHFFATPGSYLVTENITTTDGCTDSITKTVTINAPPAVSFSVPPGAVCAPSSIEFTNTTTSTAPVTRIKWNFGDPASGSLDSSSAVNPSHFYQNSGSYNVTLTELSANGCTSSFTTIVTPQQKPQASFTASDACLNAQPINFANNSQFASAYAWQFGDGDSSVISNPSHTYTEPGNYSISLIAVNGSCSDTFTGPITIYTIPEVSINVSSNSLCGPATLLTFNEGDYTSGNLWSFGDPASGSADTSTVQNGTHYYSTPGTYTVTLTETMAHGCNNSATAIVQVHATPQPSFTSANACANHQPITFTNNTPGLNTYTWYFGDGDTSSLVNPLHHYADSGSFIVKLVAQNNFCIDTYSTPLIIYAAPKVSFTVPSSAICGVPALVAPHNTSAGASNFLWNFGDSGSGLSDTSTSVNPTHAFNAIGNYNISLVGISSQGCLDTSQMPVTVNTKPTSSFTAFNSCFNAQPIKFNNSSQSATTFKWYFGDGDSSVQVNPAHSFGAPGLFNVTLIATAGLCADSFAIPVNIYTTPVAAFTAPQHALCTPDTVQVNNTTTGATSYNWNFGNAGMAGNTSTAFNPSFIYTNAGSYIITLIASNSDGCLDTASLSVSAHLGTAASFTVTDTCLNTQPVQFTNNSQNGGNYLWLFGDGTTSSQQNPLHEYSDTGTFNVELITSTGYCLDTFIAPVKIFPVPVASFTLSETSQCGPPASVLTNNNSTGANSYSWDFGNGSTSLVVDPAITYNAAGQYTVTLTATNQYSCRSTVTHPFIVYQTPVIEGIEIEPAEGCQPANITFKANTLGGNSFTWNFGTPSSSVITTTPIAAYTYADTGTYTISLQVSSSNGCGDTLVLFDTINIHPDPIANYDTIINSSGDPVDGTVAFVNESINANSYFWNFGDGSTSTDENPKHRYEQIGTYSALLIAETKYGCVDSILKSFYVMKKSLYVPNALQPNFTGSENLVKVWKPVGIGLGKYLAQVFDKWGTLLWQSDSLVETQPAEGWDGTYEGKECQQDVYVWKVNAVFIDGTVWKGMSYETDEGGGRKTIGSITLIR